MIFLKKSIYDFVTKIFLLITKLLSFASFLNFLLTIAITFGAEKTAIQIMLNLITCLSLLLFIQNSILYAQEPKIKVSAIDGVMIVGYIDDGGLSTFTGHNINLIYKNSKFIFGALPSLRYKKDNSTPRNSFITPHLGIGLTYCYKLLAVQIPLYYNTKTTTDNGNWQIGFGLGLRLNELNKKTKPHEEV